MKKRKYILAFILLTFLIGLATLFFVLPGGFLNVYPDKFDGELSMKWVVAQEGLGSRIPGSTAHKELQDLIIKELRYLGWDTSSVPCTVRENLVAYNIVAKKGVGKGVGDEWIILGAHYDSRIYADEEITQADRQMPVPGANDGGSGVAVLLELARVLSNKPLNAEIWMVFFDLEDNGRILPYQDWILGSTCFVEMLPSLSSNRSPTAAVIVDMIGDKDLQIYYEVNSSKDLREQIWDQAINLGYKQFLPRERYSIIDDHTPFLAAGIPAVDIIDFDYIHWHTLEDTSDKVSAESLEVVGRTLQSWLENR